MNILHIETVVHFSGLGSLTFIIGLLAGIVSLIAMILSIIYDEKSWGVCGFIIIWILISITSISYTIKTSYELTQYHVTLDESVSFIEISEKYEILETKGELYILTDRRYNHG